MSRPAVNESGESNERVGNCGRRKIYMEGVRIGKSGRVESDDLGGYTSGINAVLALCGGLRTA